MSNPYCIVFNNIIICQGPKKHNLFEVGYYLPEQEKNAPGR